jgi:hypothetical protein
MKRFFITTIMATFSLVAIHGSSLTTEEARKIGRIIVQEQQQGRSTNLLEYIDNLGASDKELNTRLGSGGIKTTDVIENLSAKINSDALSDSVTIDSKLNTEAVRIQEDDLDPTAGTPITLKSKIDAVQTGLGGSGSLKQRADNIQGKVGASVTGANIDAKLGTLALSLDGVALDPTATPNPITLNSKITDVIGSIINDNNAQGSVTAAITNVETDLGGEEGTLKERVESLRASYPLYNEARNTLNALVIKIVTQSLDLENLSPCQI